MTIVESVDLIKSYNLAVQGAARLARGPGGAHIIIAARSDERLNGAATFSEHMAFR